MNDPAKNDPLLYQQGECNETSGFLFSHRCGEPAMNQCVQCQKPICQRHMFANPNNTNEIFCTTCAKKFLQEKGPPSSTGGRGPGVGRPYDDYGHDPYFYTGYYYHDYPYGRYHRSGHSHTGHDFTDGDEGTLFGGEPSRDALHQFENDMGGS